MLIAAPLAGRVVALADVPDVVFAEEIVGPGIAVEPTRPIGDMDSHLCAPISGVLGSLFPHAFAIVGFDGRSVLVHAGIDTIGLKGEGFTTLARVGQVVTAGQAIVRWNPAAVAAAGLATVCPVIALDGDTQDIALLVGSGDEVTQADALFEWSS